MICYIICNLSVVGIFYRDTCLYLHIELYIGVCTYTVLSAMSIKVFPVHLWHFNKRENTCADELWHSI